MRRGRYYLGRVVKVNLDQERLMDAIANAPIVNIGKFDWTITDIEDCRNDEEPYVFGKMSNKWGQMKLLMRIKGVSTLFFSI